VSVSPGFRAHKQRFGKRLRSLRIDAGMSQVQLARALPKPDGSQVSRWERGETMPEYDSLIALASLFGVWPGWLEWGDETEKPSDPEGSDG
jgi:transcriptional regulator with XRE-family HTH domain